MILLHLLLETCLEFGPKRLGLRKVVFYDVGDHVQCDDSILLQFFVFLLLFVQKEIILSLLLLFLHLRDKLPLNLLWTLHFFQVWKSNCLGHLLLLCHLALNHLRLLMLNLRRVLNLFSLHFWDSNCLSKLLFFTHDRGYQLYYGLRLDLLRKQLFERLLTVSHFFGLPYRFGKLLFFSHLCRYHCLLVGNLLGWLLYQHRLDLSIRLLHLKRGVRLWVFDEWNLVKWRVPSWQLGVLLLRRRCRKVHVRIVYLLDGGWHLELLLRDRRSLHWLNRELRQHGYTREVIVYLDFGEGPVPLKQLGVLNLGLDHWLPHFLNLWLKLVDLDSRNRHRELNPAEL